MNVLALIIVLLICGCGRQSKTLKIAVVPMHQSIFYWKCVHEGAVKAARQLHVDVTWQGPLVANDRSGQIDITDNLIGTVPNALVLAPVDSKALSGPVDNAFNAKIPTIIIDSALDDPHQQAFIATDNLAAGKLAADYMAKRLNGKGNVAVLRGVEGTASTDAREKGFLEQIANYPGIKIVSKNVRGGENSETARAAGENILAPLKTANGYDLQGVFCSMESLTFGMMLALDNAGLTGKTKLVGFDFSDQLVRGVDTGHIDALIAQDPVQLGYLGVAAAVASARGQAVEKLHYIPAVIVTRDNLHNPVMWARVSPDLSDLN